MVGVEEVLADVDQESTDAKTCLLLSMCEGRGGLQICEGRERLRWPRRWEVGGGVFERQMLRVPPKF